VETDTVSPSGTGEGGRSYMFSNASQEGGNQVRHLAQVLDPHTTNVLRGIGIEPGERWLEVGAGLGTVTEFLLDQGARVTAIDIDPRHLSRLEGREGVEIIQGDIRGIDLGDRRYGGIIGRLVAMHLSEAERRDLLTRGRRALVPGGALVLGDWVTTGQDLVRRSPSDEATALLEAFQTGLAQLAQAAGLDLGWGERALAAMVEVGYRDVVTYYDSRTFNGGDGICLLHASNSRQKQDQLVEAGMSLDQLEQLRRLLNDPAVTLSSYLMCTTVGYRPSLTLG
jgi:SAM-dependent methyltransferase